MSRTFKSLRSSTARNKRRVRRVDRTNLPVRLELVDGELMKLPGFFFGDWSDRASARLFACEFAKALRVEVSDTE